MVTNSGGGYSRWHDLAVTRWREDSTCDNWGSFVYIRALAGLYVTADALSGVPTGSGATLKVKQDLKYPPGSKGAQDPNLQRWRFA